MTYAPEVFDLPQWLSSAQDTAILALIVALPVIVIALRVVWRFRDHWRQPGASSPTAHYLMHGIFWGFLAGALNTAWWSIRWIALVLGEWETVAWFVHWGGLADPLTKGPIAYAAYYHLKAIRVGSLRKRKGK